MINDCFAVEDRLMSLDDAFALIGRRVDPVTAAETVPLGQALDRVLAEDVVSPLTQSPFANAAMDGFAVRHAELAGDQPTRLEVGGRIAAGHPLAAPPPPGQAVEIFTGAPMPAGFDTVVMIEDGRIDEAAGRRWVTLPAGVVRGRHVRPVGEDFQAGDTVLRAGRRLRPQDLAMAAAVGRAELPVHRRLAVGVLSTGDEVIEPGQPLAPGQIYASNRFGLIAMLESLGCAVTDLGHLPDDLPATVEAFRRAAEGQQAIVTSGGMSMGGEDHVRDAVEALGSLHLWRLAIKPGKPVALGRIGGASFLGLPGYPVSAMVTLMVVGRAVLKRLGGAVGEPALPPALPVTAGFSFKKRGNRREFLRAALAPGAGGLVARPYRSQESSVISSLVESHGLIDVGAEMSEIVEGQPVPFLSYESLMR